MARRTTARENRRAWIARMAPLPTPHRFKPATLTCTGRLMTVGRTTNPAAVVAARSSQSPPRARSPRSTTSALNRSALTGVRQKVDWCKTPAAASSRYDLLRRDCGQRQGIHSVLRTGPVREENTDFGHGGSDCNDLGRQSDGRDESQH